MKRLVLLSWLFLCCTGASAQTQEPDPLSFFPHQVGDTWVYVYNGASTAVATITRVETDDEYNIWIYTEGFQPPTYRVTPQYEVYFSPMTSNYLDFKLDAAQGDTWKVAQYESSRLVARVEGLYQGFVLGLPSTIMEIAYFEVPVPDTIITDESPYRYTQFLASGFGFIRQLGESGNVPIDLVGCIIDGDTLGIVTDVADRNTAPPVALRITPNPCDVAATLQCALPAGVLSAHVELGDVFGRVLYSTEMQGETCTIPTASLAEGMYFCRVVAAQHTAVQMVCVQR